LPVCADAKVFLQILLAAIGKTRGARIMTSKEWLRWCQEKKKKYPVVLPEYARQSRAGQTIHPYYFVAELSQQLPAGATVVAGNGTASVVWFQAGEVKVGQRVIWNSGCASMGYDLPAAVGACIGKGKKPVVCIAGDGSLQMNIQELQTMFHYNLPIKLFVLNNRGYVSIRQTQDGFFGGNYVGSGPDSGVSFPDIIKVARAYGIRAQKISSADGLKQKLAGILGSKGPVVCEVALPPDYVFSPKLASFRLPDGKLESKPLEDMSPFLGREEFIQNMLVPLWESR
jgi:acetolactate synthase-1/2/3 large subunit